MYIILMWSSIHPCPMHSLLTWPIVQQMLYMCSILDVSYIYYTLILWYVARSSFWGKISMFSNYLCKRSRLLVTWLFGINDNVTYPLWCPQSQLGYSYLRVDLFLYSTKIYRITCLSYDYCWDNLKLGTTNWPEI